MIPRERFCLGCMTEQNGEQVCPNCGWRGTNPQESALFLAPGTVLNQRYLIGRVLGYGGFGITYLAFDLDLHLKLAIKEYLPRNWATRALGSAGISVYSGEARDCFAYGLERFVEEARILAKFNVDPCIVLVHGFFLENSTAYIVMEYIEGITLHEYLDRKGGTIPYAEAMEIVNPIMDALRKVHHAGILHRDISPDNIYIARDGQVKLLDFGSARYAPGEQSQSLSVMLKPGYAPLEQYQTKGDQGSWTDVYGVAATIYRAITGTTPPEAAARVDVDKLQAPSELGAAIPPETEAVLIQALSVKPKERFQTIDEFQDALAGRLNYEKASGAAKGEKPVAANRQLPGFNSSNAGLTVEKGEPLKRSNFKLGAFAIGALLICGLIIRAPVGPSFRKFIQPETAQPAPTVFMEPNQLADTPELTDTDQSLSPRLAVVKPQPIQGPEPVSTSQPPAFPPVVQNISNVIYVRPSGNDQNPGTGWASSKQTVQAGIDAARPGAEVWVAAGTYVGNFILKNGVKLLGGFAGNETAADQRDWSLNQTILDGNRQNSVIQIASSATGVVIDGFTIQNGKSGNNGGGIHCQPRSETRITHCIIRNNLAERGGGLCLNNAASLIMEKCVVSENRGNVNGGGIYFNRNSIAVLNNNEIKSNTTGEGGGGLAIYGHSVKVEKCIITNNRAEIKGGGVFTYQSSSTLDQNTITGNQAVSIGGGVYVSQGSPRITNCIIGGNSVGGGNGSGDAGGAGIYCNQGLNVLIAGNQIYDNIVDSSGSGYPGGGGVYLYKTEATVVNCKVTNNRAINRQTGWPHAGGIGVRRDSKVKIYNSVVSGNRVECLPPSRNYGDGGGIALRENCAMEVINCSIIGNTAPGGGGIHVSKSADPITVINTIIAYNSSGVDSQDGSSRLVSRHNCYYANTAYHYRNLAAGPGDITADPKLNDYKKGNYHLDAGSPCIDAGDGGAVKAEWTDADGKERIWGTGVDIGAFEEIFEIIPPVVGKQLNAAGEFTVPADTMGTRFTASSIRYLSIYH